MRKISKWILSALCATCAFAGVVTLQGGQEMTTASAAVATEYTTVETTVMARIEDVYVGNGNFSLYLLVPELDTGNKKAEVSFAGVDLASAFNKLGFFDNVKIGEKTLRELGCTGFWMNSIGINAKEVGAFPYNHLQLYCTADVDTWKAAYNAGEVKFGTSTVTVAEGTLIPGYAYLNGDENAKLYRASCEFETRVEDPQLINYGLASYAKTDIEAFEYVQGHDGACGYLGVSLEGDDYLGDGVQVVSNQNYKNHFNSFVNTISLNGQLNTYDGNIKDYTLAKYYGLFNLGEKGKGYYSFATTIHENDLESITVPAGTLFPSKALNGLVELNGTYPVIVFETQTTQTFYKNAEGKYVSFEGYLKSAKADVQATYEAKIADCFAEDVATLESAIATANAGLNSANSIADIDVVYMEAKAVFGSVLTKTEVAVVAKADLDDYKAEEGYFRDAENATRADFIAEAKAVIDGATTKAAIETVVVTTKTKIDGLKTAAQYADEELADDKAAAREEINGYQANVAYLEEQAAVYAEAVETALAAVASAKNAEEIAAAVTGMKTTVDTLETKESIVDAAKAEINGYKAEEGLYREKEANRRAEVVGIALEMIDNATTQAAINEAVESAKVKIDTLKTAAELTEEEKNAANEALAQDKQDALDKINEIKAGVDYSKYSAENQAKINDLYKAAKDLVEDALTEGEIRAAVSAFETEIAKVPQLETNDNNNDVGPEGGANGIMAQLGCASVVGVSGVTALTLALGFVGLCMKKRKED